MSVPKHLVSSKVTWTGNIDWPMLDFQCELIGRQIDDKITKKEQDEELTALEGVHDLLSEIWEQRPKEHFP